jgi:lipopolysaccharide biosynthesis regulator YciM
MDFDLGWLLLALPVAFALGWIGSRIDLRQWKREQRGSPRAYYQGLVLLLNEQPDKAIDAFIEAVQGDADTTELHFALGNLFRRRGEFERAVRVHQHLMQRADLSANERARAQEALAQDYLKAGLFDRAEEAYRALEGTPPFETEARLALLALAERSRDWRSAATVAALLEKSGAGSFATRIAHHHCELALEAEARGDAPAATALLQAAETAAPQAVRPLMQRAQRSTRMGDHDAAWALWSELARRHPEAFARAAGEAVAAAMAAKQTRAAGQTLAALFDQQPGIDLLRALATLEGVPAGASPRLMTLLREQPSLSAVLEVLDTPAADWPDAVRQFVRDAVARAAQSQQRYRCAACGFEAQRHFWQCPVCLGWDTFPPRHIEEL